MRIRQETVGLAYWSKAIAQSSLVIASCMFWMMPGDIDASEKMIPRISVQVDKPLHEVSPMLYGVCLEEINHALDGGLCAELIPNRSFEFGEYPEHWYLVVDEQSQVEMNIDDSRPMSKENPHSLRLKIDELKNGKMGVANSGFWGISLIKDEVYDLSLSACANEGFAGRLTVNLESMDGKEIFAAATIGPLSTEWKTYKAELTSNAAHSPCRLAIHTHDPGTIWLDMVSLLPRGTWNNSPHGLRNNLAEMITALHPAFIRHQNFRRIENSETEKLFHWKQSIGDVANRGNLWNRWRYVSSNGFGYNEYLEFCESLKAKPWLVVDCSFGGSANRATPDKIKEHVQNILDAIEYANGSETTIWGAKRTEAGHPQSFNLAYIEISNEGGNPIHNDCCAYLYDEIKAKYPYIKIVTSGWDYTSDFKSWDLVNERYYGDRKLFLQNAHKYDAYDGKGRNICIGEYAVTHEAGHGNLHAAVAEAVFMTGMERNSNVVQMAAYSPLLANINDKTWNPSLINYDGTRAFGTPSYYVQKIFAQHRGNTVLPIDMNYTTLKKEVSAHGVIGLGTWLTQAEYKDIVVTQGDKVLYKSDFSKSPAEWKVVRGKWAVKDGALQQTANIENPVITAGDPSWTNYTLSLKARKLSGQEGFIVLFHVTGNDDYLWWNIGGWENSQNALEVTALGKRRATVSEKVAGKIENNRWYDIMVKVKDYQIRCYINGQLLQDIKYPGTESFVAISTDESNSKDIHFINAASVHNSEQDALLMPKSGAIGVGTWQSQAEFKEIRVKEGNKILFSSDDTKDLSKDWKIFGGDWKVNNGVIRQSDFGSGSQAVTGNKNWTNYSLSLKARKLSGAEGFLILFRTAGEKDFIWWNLGGWGGDQYGLEMTVNGKKSTIGKTVSGKIENDRWYDIRIDLQSDKIRCYLDGELIHLVNYPVIEPLFAVAGLNEAKDEIILKVVNVTQKDQDTEIVLDSDKSLSPTAKMITLTSENAADENSLDNPTKVAPVETNINNVGPEFHHAFPANSVTVMRIKIKSE